MPSIKGKKQLDDIKNLKGTCHTRVQFPPSPPSIQSEPSYMILQDLTSISELVNSFFKDDAKTTLWLNTENPLLGNQKPINMVFLGRTKKLEVFIKNQLKGNTP